MAFGARTLTPTGPERPGLRNTYAPGQREAIAVCPHCWEVNVHASLLCGRCGADMRLALQESGGLRATAPVQSPVPMRGARLTTLQRALVLCFVALLIVAHVIGALYSSGRSATSPSDAPRSSLPEESGGF